MPQHSRANPVMDAGYKVELEHRFCAINLWRAGLLTWSVQVLMRRNSVYVFVILAGALAGERVREYPPTVAAILVL